MSDQNVCFKIFDPSSNLTFSYLADHTNISEIPDSFSVHKSCFLKFVDHAHFSLHKSKSEFKKSLHQSKRSKSLNTFLQNHRLCHTIEFFKICYSVFLYAYSLTFLHWKSNTILVFHLKANCPCFIYTHNNLIDWIYLWLSLRRRGSCFLRFGNFAIALKICLC